MTSLARMLDIIDLFSLQQPVVRAEDVSQRLNYSRATAYRYLKALCDAGFLSLTSDGVYTLGPRILELERLQHLTDPLLLSSQEIVATLAAETPGTSFLICSSYRDRVLCIHQDGAEHFVTKGRTVPLLRARGLPFPLFSGGASLAILAFLSPYRIRALYLDKEQEIAKSGLATSWREFRARINAIKADGYALTAGHFNPDLATIAAPIYTSGGQVIGSLAWVMLREDFAQRDESACAEQVITGARAVTARLAELAAGVPGTDGGPIGQDEERGDAAATLKIKK